MEFEDVVDCQIVGLKEFFALPEGTIYADWTPSIVGEPMIKGETIYHDGVARDFGCSTLGADLYLGSDGADYDRVVVDDIYGRWGLFDDDAQFVVYPPAAVRKVIAKLQAALAASESTS